MPQKPTSMASRAADTYQDVNLAMGFRPPTGYPRSWRGPIRFFKTFALVNSSTAVVDLTQDWVDINILRAAGNAYSTTSTGALTPSDNPAVVIHIERASFVLVDQTTPTAAQVDAIMESIEGWTLVHQPPGSDLREVPLIQLLDSISMGTGQNGGYTTSGATATSSVPNLRNAEPQYLPLGPLVVDLQHDTFVLKPSISKATGTPVVGFVFEGLAFSNSGWIPANAGGQCDDSPQGTIERVADLMRAHDRVAQPLSVLRRAQQTVTRILGR